jgi:uncharacterized protein with GYD domain
MVIPPPRLPASPRHFETTLAGQTLQAKAVSPPRDGSPLACASRLPDDLHRGVAFPQGRYAMMFILSLNFTDQGIRNIKDAPKRAHQARELAKKVGVDIKQVYMTTGDSDLVVMVEAPNGDSMVKFAMATGMQGNVRTRTARAWTLEEYQKLIAELP